MKRMKFLKRNVNTFLLLAIVLVINWLGSSFYSRLDLTQEKKFSLSSPTKSFLKSLDDVVSVRVFLTGKLPAGMEELEQATADLLNEFKAYGGRQFEYDFIDISAMSQDVQAQMGQDLINIGLQPTSLKVVESGEQTQKVIFPGAVVTYKGSSVPVTLLQNQVGLDQYQVLSNSITLLEYKMANAIQKLQSDKKPTIAFTQGHGEPNTALMNEMIESLQRENFAVAAIDLKTSYRVDPLVSVLVITKPTIPFAEKEKYKIDQFVMRGGKVLWLLDKMALDMDSLGGTNQFMAQEREVNLDDILFKYGVRINADVIADLQNTKIEIQTGTVNGAPQMERFDWVYYPLFTPTPTHPVSKGLAPVSGKFASSIDTIRVDGIEKNVLLTTSNYSKALLSPVRVHLGILGDQPSPENFKQPNLVTGISLEGSFQSIFKNRLTQSFLEIQDTVESLAYLEQSEPTKMIVISDGDIILNEYNSKQTFPLGFGYYGPNNAALVFDNKPFLKNCIEYLIDDNNLIETRSKEFKLRQLDPVAVKASKMKWQFANLVYPTTILLFFSGLWAFIRRRKYATA